MGYRGKMALMQLINNLQSLLISTSDAKRLQSTRVLTLGNSSNKPRSSAAPAMAGDSLLHSASRTQGWDLLHAWR